MLAPARVNRSATMATVGICPAPTTLSLSPALSRKDQRVQSRYSDDSPARGKPNAHESRHRPPSGMPQSIAVVNPHRERPRREGSTDASPRW